VKQGAVECYRRRHTTTDARRAKQCGT